MKKEKRKKKKRVTVSLLFRIRYQTRALIRFRFFFLKFLYLSIYFKEQIERHLTLVMGSFVKSMIMGLFFNFFLLDCVEENIIWWKVINNERKRQRVLIR